MQETTHRPSPRRLPRRHAAALFLLVAIGAVLRSYKLDYHSLWSDELESWRMSRPSSMATAIDLVRADVHPPGYLLLLHYVQKLFGDSEIALRSPSVLAGILCIPLIFVLGRRLYSAREGLLAAGLTAVLSCPVYYSQEARVNSILLLMTLVSTRLWHTLFFDEGSPTKPLLTLFSYSASAAAMCYLHYFGVFLVALQAAYAGLLTILARRQPARWLAAYAGVLLAYSPWLPALLEDLGRRTYWLPPPQDLAFLELLLFFFNWSVPVVAIVIVLMSAAVVLEVRDVLKSGAPGLAGILKRPTVLVILWLTVPFAIAFLKSLSSAPVLTGRSMIIVLPAAYLLTVRPIARLPLGGAYLTAVGAAVVGSLLAHLLFVVRYYETPSETQFREASIYLSEQDPLYRDALILGFAKFSEHFDYYFKRLGFPKRAAANVGLAEDGAETLEILRRSNPRHVFYIYAHRIPEPAFLELLERELTVLARREFGSGAGVVLYRNDRYRSGDDERAAVPD